MRLEQVIAKMEALTDRRAIEAWARMRVSPENYLGVNLTKLKTLSKEIKKDHELALQLWNSKIHDAKLLATMIEESKKVTLDQIDRQVKEIYSIDLADKFSNNVVAKTKFLQQKVDEWTVSQEEMIKRCGYILLFSQAKNDENLPDEYFEKFLDVIERGVQSEKNWIKEAMNYVLIGIGCRNKNLNRRAIQVAKKVGKIEIDYGDTSCKAPDALTKLGA
jgi:3-methyladenine DNA glycosylase AlkD